MAGSLALWGRIIANPFVGYAQVKKDTKVAGPLVCLLVLVAATTTLMLPITRSEEYAAASLRLQQEQLRKLGVAPDASQLEAMRTQMESPAARALAIVFAYLGGLLGYIGTLLVVAALMRLLVVAARGTTTLGLLYRVLVFAGIVTMVQGLLKAGIVLAGDWRSALGQVRSARDLGTAIQASLSLTLLIPAASLGRFGSVLVDGATDVFNLVHYLFIYAGLRSAVGLKRGQALVVTIASAVVYLGIAVAIALLL